MTDGVLTTIIIQVSSIISTAIIVVVPVLRSNKRQTEKMQNHVDTAVDKVNDTVKKELAVRRSTLSMPILTGDFPVDHPLHREP